MAELRESTPNREKQKKTVFALLIATFYFELYRMLEFEAGGYFCHETIQRRADFNQVLKRLKII